jgi:hypothetical protein
MKIKQRISWHRSLKAFRQKYPEIIRPDWVWSMDNRRAGIPLPDGEIELNLKLITN